MAYVSPAAAWSGTIENILQRREEERLQREEKNRQDLLDQHKIRQDEATLKLRQDELDQRRQDRERDDADRKELQKDKIAERKRVGYEKTVAGMKPGDTLTPDMTSVAMETGNASDLMNPKQGLRDFADTLPPGSPLRAGVVAQTGTPSTEEMVKTQTPLRFVGSPAQRDVADKQTRIRGLVSKMGVQKPGSPEWLQTAAEIETSGGTLPAATLKLMEPHPDSGNFSDYLNASPEKRAAIDAARGSYTRAGRDQDAAAAVAAQREATLEMTRQRLADAQGKKDKPTTLSAAGKANRAAIEQAAPLTDDALAMMEKEFPGIAANPEKYNGPVDKIKSLVGSARYWAGFSDDNDPRRQIVSLLQPVQAGQYMRSSRSRQMLDLALKHMGDMTQTPAAQYRRLKELRQIMPEMYDGLMRAESPVDASNPRAGSYFETSGTEAPAAAPKTLTPQEYIKKYGGG